MAEAARSANDATPREQTRDALPSPLEAGFAHAPTNAASDRPAHFPPLGAPHSQAGSEPAQESVAPLAGEPMQRIFTASSPTPSLPDHRDFTPGAWDMWAPWLDGGVDPNLQHSGANVSAEPLVPVALPEPGATPASEAGVARFTGIPSPFPAPESAPESAAEHASDAPEAAPRQPTASDDAAEPTLSGAVSPLDPVTRRDPDPGHREPHFSSAAAAAEPFAAAPESDHREHFAVTRETRTPARGGGFLRAFGWLVAIGLVLLLVLQLAWWQREKLMLYWPQSQHLFSSACVSLGCTVLPPRAIDGLRLDASDLRQLDGPRVLELKVPLTNRYPVALAYPSIELTLLDEANNVAVRRVLAPRDYVRPGTPVDAGMPAGATQTMVVRIDTGGASASNFRVQIFYP
ncbi:DUF3426 domain-containing protein [Burkholderia alba]|uniref:DUF3426 domain-containing protein n=1 Tax=Burkholderia alba TaxID=2683677 RepID=UPI002B055A22|nr:DUF3426 domain-containing protein [Burkholderia alba]